jgi:MarR family transcriptional repressor of emrRAB
MPSEGTESPLLALQRATHSTLQVLSRRLAALDLTAAEMNALAALADGRERTVSELGAAVGSRPTTLTSVLDRLERRGHLARGARPGNRRVVVLHLSDSGRAAAATVRRAMTELETEALRGLPAETVAAFHTVLRALSEVPR